MFKATGSRSFYKNTVIIKIIGFINIVPRFKQWRFYIGARGLNPPNHEKERISPQIPRMVHILFAGVVRLTDLTGSAVATDEANEATASVNFVSSVKI